MLLKLGTSHRATLPKRALRQLEARVGIRVLADQGSAAKPECEQLRALLEARLAERPEDRNSLIALASGVRLPGA
jgi:hypothetical protein